MITIIAGDAQVQAVRDAIAGGARVVPPAEWQGRGSAVIWLDELTPSEVRRLQTLLTETMSRPIGVLGARWDGFVAIPLAAHCRGVISGFGLAGLHTALATLRETSAR